MTSPSPIANAVDKLAAAISAAEAAVDARARDAQAGGGAAESQELEAALASLRREHASLKAVADDVARRLDNAIEQVESILSGRV